MLSLLLFLSCSAKLSHSLSVDGTAVSGQFPFAVGFHGCSGSLLDETTVLTAAHCVCQEDWKSVIVTAGSVNFHQPEVHATPHIVTRIIPHSAYRCTEGSSGRFDIAILKLLNPVQLNDYRNTVELDCSDVPEAGQNVTILGYGVSDKDEVGYLRYADVTLDRECPSTPDLELCAKLGNYFTHKEDRGGPVVVIKNNRYVQVGIVSKFSAGRLIMPSVMQHCQWIKKMM